MYEIMKGIRSILEASQAVRPEDQVMVIADNDGGSVWLGHLIMDVSNSMGAQAILTIMDPRQIVGGEPPQSVALAMKSANAIFRITDSDLALGHSSARQAATVAGARYYIVRDIMLDELMHGVNAADIQTIKERTERVAQKLTEAVMGRVVSPSGTDITMTLAGRPGMAFQPRSPIVASLPDYAEAAIAPLEGTAEGIMVFDLAVVQWKYLFRKPLTCTVKAGKIVDISGLTEDADRMRKAIATDKGAGIIAELGIGTSHLMPWAMRGFRRDAARIGTAHIGIGRNDGIGGITWSQVHLDGLIDQASVELDKHYVLKDGVLLI